MSNFKLIESKNENKKIRKVMNRDHVNHNHGAKDSTTLSAKNAPIYS